MNQEEIQKAVSILCKALKEDRDYYLVWHKNITLAITNDMQIDGTLTYWEAQAAISQGVKSFLDLLIHINSVEENL